MARTYEHTFADLHSDQSELQPSVVDLTEAGGVQDQTGARINPAPGNPDAGKPDQFGDIGGERAGADADVAVDDGVDVDLQDADELAGETTEETDDDLKRLSAPQRDRIMRERRLRQESEERTRTLEAELAAVNQKIDLQANETKWRSEDEKDDAELAKLKDQKVKALEEGKTVDVVDLDDKITDLKAAKRARDSERAKAREAAAAKPKAAAGSVTNPKAQAWISKHPAYNTDPLFRDAVHAADRLLYAQGFNANSDDYYVRMTRMLNESGKFTLDPSYLKGGAKRGGSPRGGGSQGVRNQTGAVRRGDNGRTSVTITAADKALLAQMGQDPQDPAVLKAYAREKIAQARADAARGDQ